MGKLSPIKGVYVPTESNSVKTDIDLQTSSLMFEPARHLSSVCVRKPPHLSNFWPTKKRKKIKGMYIS